MLTAASKVTPLWFRLGTGCRADAGGRRGVEGAKPDLKQTEVVGLDSIYKTKMRGATLQSRHPAGLQFCPEIGEWMVLVPKV